MEKKEKKLNLVKDNSKFLITIGTCVILLMLMFYVGTNTSKQTFSALSIDCSSLGKVEYNGQCCKIEHNLSTNSYNEPNATIALSSCKQVSSHINCQAIGPYECSGHIDATTGECEHSEWDGKFGYKYDKVTECEAIPTSSQPSSSQPSSGGVTDPCSVKITKSASSVSVGSLASLTAEVTFNVAGSTINHYEWSVGEGLSLPSGSSSQTVTVQPYGVNPHTHSPASYSVKAVVNIPNSGTKNCTASGTIAITTGSSNSITANGSISPSSDNYTKGSGDKTITVQYNAYDVGSVDCGAGSWSVSSNNSANVTLSSVSVSEKTTSLNKSTFKYSIKDSAFNGSFTNVEITATFTPTKTACPSVTKTATITLGASSSSKVTKYQCWFCSDGANHWVPETSSPTQAAQSAGITSTYTCSYVQTELNT